MDKHKNVDNVELVGFMKDHSNAEAAAHFGVSEVTISRRLRELNLGYYDLKYGHLPKELTGEQLDVVEGTMLGDATINSKSLYYCLSQRITNQEYVDHVAAVLHPFVSQCDTVPANPESKRLNATRYVRTITSPIFKKLRSEWYKDGKKIVPPLLKLNAKKVAYWFCDDGCNLAHRKRISFATQSFDRTEVGYLVDELKTLGIRSTMGKCVSGKPIITVWQRDYLLFLDMIKPYIVWDCFAYKLDTDKMPQTKLGYGAFKLKPGDATEIRTLYDDGNGRYSQAELAETFQVSRRMINLIVNGKAHNSKPNMGTKGTAEVSLIFKVEACLSKTKTGPSSNCKDQTHS